MCTRYRGLVSESLRTWFAREVLPHEAALMRYLGRVCADPQEVPDLRQDVYVKVYEAAMHRRPAVSRAFVLTIARNLVVDRVRHSRIVSIRSASDPDALNVLIDELSPERRTQAGQELKRLGAAFHVMPPKCREVMWLRKVDELSQVEVARQMNLSVRTVEFHVRKGMRILAQVLFGEEQSRLNERDEPNGSESENGQ
jgi:RNA polymerase sigma-70 factor (ECF subfamily)